MASGPTTRRSFFGLAGSAALFCTIGGKKFDVSAPGGLAEADAAAAQVGRPRAAASLAVPQIQPAPGGTRREYWVLAETVRWAITPTRRDDWHGRRFPSRNLYTAFVYRLMTPGFADYAAAPTIPGPTLTAEVGDVLVVHFRNADRKLDQAVSMHPHGVEYTPEYDGAYMGEYTRAGGFIAPARRSPTSGRARPSRSAPGPTTTTGLPPVTRLQARTSTASTGAPTRATRRR